LSFGTSQSVTVTCKKASIADSLATSIANYVNGDSSEDAVNNALEVAENYKEYLYGVLIIKEDFIGKIGKLPEIISTKPFDIS